MTEVSEVEREKEARTQLERRYTVDKNRMQEGKKGKGGRGKGRREEGILEEKMMEIKEKEKEKVGKKWKQRGSIE